MQLIQLIYENQPIEFSKDGEETVMVNATQMAKIFDKRIDVFRKADHVKAFILELELTPYGGSSVPLKRDEIIKTVNGNATFMHKILALKFASWLSPKIEIWIYSKIDELILGSYRNHKLATIEKLKAQEDLENKKNQLIANNPDLQEFFNMETKVTSASKKQAKAIRETVKEIQIQCFP